MLGQLSGRDDRLGGRNVVVWKEDQLQEVLNFWVVIDDGTNRVDEVDDHLGPCVAWSGFTSDHHYTSLELGFPLLSWRGLNFDVAVDAPQEVQKLTLILMNSLDLDVIKSVERDVIAGLSLNPSLETHFIFTLNLGKLLDEGRVGGLRG